MISLSQSLQKIQLSLGRFQPDNWFRKKILIKSSVSEDWNMSMTSSERFFWCCTVLREFVVKRQFDWFERSFLLILGKMNHVVNTISLLVRLQYSKYNSLFFPHHLHSVFFRHDTYPIRVLSGMYFRHGFDISRPIYYKPLSRHMFHKVIFKPICAAQSMCIRILFIVASHNVEKKTFI